jgi:uncharacterized protein YodC (DUF2158 family)
MSIQVGSTVWLKSGSPYMTVSAMGSEGRPDVVVCTWFPAETCDPAHYTFPIDTLTLIKPGRHPLA